MGKAKYEGSINVRSKFATHKYTAFILCSAQEKSNADFPPRMKRDIVSGTTNKQKKPKISIFTIFLRIIVSTTFIL